MLGKSRENARRKVLRAHERPIIARACFIIFRSRVARTPNGWKFVNATWRANGSRHVNATRERARALTTREFFSVLAVFFALTSADRVEHVSVLCFHNFKFDGENAASAGAVIVAKRSLMITFFNVLFVIVVVITERYEPKCLVDLRVCWL
jgi:hypothetical protein